MGKICKSVLWLFVTFFAVSNIYAQHDVLARVFSVTACPAENCENSMNFSWATDTTIKSAVLEIAPLTDKEWKKSVSYAFDGVLNTTFDGVHSKGPRGENFYESVVINKYNATVDGLKKDTRYKYRIYPVAAEKSNFSAVGASENYRGAKDKYYSTVRSFKTSGAKEWEACIISDFHVYSPLYARTEAAMDMIGVVEDYAVKDGIRCKKSAACGSLQADMPLDWILHLGDITAWGGSYSFWKNLYKEQPFKKYMWAGVNGNHDNMTRGYDRTTNEFFRDAAAYPMNGYEGEMGVCYHFRYGDVLFIMLNNEGMKSDGGLAAAQEWVRKVVKENPAPYTVVCEHYQWFYGESGKESQYSRWCELFDELGVNLALAGNTHIYVSSYPIYSGKSVATGADAASEEFSAGYGKKRLAGAGESGKGTVYIQTPSSDNERGVAIDASKPLEQSADKIKFRWSEGGNTVGAMHMKVTPQKMTLTLLDRNGNVLDVTEVLPK